MYTDLKSSPGFLGKGLQTPQSADEARKFFDNGVICLLGDRVAEAYDYFSRIEKADAAVWFNMALCCRWAGLFKNALSCVEKAEQDIAQMQYGAVSGSVQEQLDAYDAQGAGYLQPMPTDHVRLMPQAAQRQILRCRADICFELGLHAEVRAIAARLKRPCRNVEELLNRINQIDNGY